MPDQGARPFEDLSPSGQIAGHVGVVWVSGEDRLDFLHRMGTNRLADLESGQGRATAFVTDAGRVVDMVTCHVGPEGIAIVTSGPGAAMILAEHLRRYVLYADRVRVTDASDQVVVIRLLGPGAGAAAEEGAQTDAESLACGSWRVIRDGQVETWLLRHADPGGMSGFDIVAPMGAVADAIASRLTAWGVHDLTDGEYAASRVSMGLPEFGAEIDGTTNPYEVGLSELVSDDKGCYIGQEVLARLATYDKVQRRLVTLVTDDALEVGALVAASGAEDRQAGPRAGRVTTAAMLDDGRWAALALVPREIGPGETVVVEATDGTIVIRARELGDGARGGLET